MKLQATLKELKDLDKKYHDLYEKVGDEYVFVGVEDKDYKTKIAEFREHNIKLSNQVKTLGEEAEKFKDVDPEKYAEMQKNIDELKDKNLMDQGKVDELIEHRTERLRTESADKLKKLEERAVTAEKSSTDYLAKLNSITVNEAITTAINNKYVAKQGAMPFILGQAAKVWAVGEEGKLEAKDQTGAVIYGKDGKEPISVAEWTEDLSKDSTFLFGENKGGGAGGGAGGDPTGSNLSKSDKEGFSQNIEDIASGKVVVS